MFDTFSGSFPVNISSAIVARAIEHKSEQYQCDIKCNFHMLHIIVHELDLLHGVTNQHPSSTDSSQLAHEHD